MKKRITVGYVVEYNGQYWGWEYQDGKCSAKNYLDGIENAIIANIDIKEPTDLTWTPKDSWPYIVYDFKFSNEYGKLKLGKLVKIRKTVTFEEIG